MSSDKSRTDNRPAAGRQPAGTDGARNDARRLKAVPDLADGQQGAPDSAYVYEPPDVIGIERKRAGYREAIPGISDEDLDSYIEVYRSHLSPATVATYQAALVPFYKHAEAHGFHPLKCETSDIEAYLLHLMTSGKKGADGQRDADDPYSTAQFKKILAALRAAAAAQGLPNPAENVDIKKLISGYTRLFGSKLPDNAKIEVLFDQLVEVERREREGSTRRAAMPRAAVALGCDPGLLLTVGELCGLTFADVELAEDHARITARCRGTASDTVVSARPGDPACPVAALKDLRSAVHRKMRADRKGRAPTESQIGAESVFANARTGEPLSRPGLRKVVAKACAGLSAVAEPEMGMLPPLTAAQRRESMAAAMDAKAVRDLALVFHAAFTSGRVSEVARFRVCDIEIIGYDSDGMNTATPLVDQAEEDGTVTTGVVDRVAALTETDLLDCDGNSLYESGLITGVHNIYASGTKNKDGHENWHPAQPGHPACPVRLLVQWLKTYDRLLLGRHSRRLAPEDPLYTRIKNPGEPIADMSHTLGGIVKEWIGGLGINPQKYSGHSLRKARDSFVLNQNGSMTECMVHAGRSSEPAGLAYAHRNPRNPLAGDPTKNVYDKMAELADQEPAAAAKAEPDEPPNPEPTTPPPADTARQQAVDPPGGAPESAASAIGDTISAFRSAVEELRAAGLNGKAIAALAELDLAPDEHPGTSAGKTPETPARPRNPKPKAEAQRPHRTTQRRR